MHAMYLFFVDDSKILHFTSPVAIVITTSELRPEIVGTCDNAHTDNQTKQQITKQRIASDCIWAHPLLSWSGLLSSNFWISASNYGKAQSSNEDCDIVFFVLKSLQISHLR